MTTARGSILETVGLSPKALAAFAWPTVVAVGAAVASWIATGDFNATEIRTALGGFITGVIAFIGAYIAKPGDVRRV